MVRGPVLSFQEARRLRAENPRARWRDVAGALGGEVWPEVRPSFRISPTDTVFTIGSCFARNIERHLAAAGCRVPMLDFHLPPEEWSGGVSGAMNKFHPPAFRQSLDWAAAIFDRDGRVCWADCEPLAFDWGDGRAFDMDMGVTEPVSRERFLERRQHIYDIFSSVFAADCMMLTPGLIEAWRDRTTGLYLHAPPLLKPMFGCADRWELEILSHEQCLADLLEAIDLVRARNPAIKVMVTTSPVPLATTFSGQDILVANSFSKSVLRAVCGAVSLQRPQVDYFPSYECATLSFPVRVWDADRVHVSEGFIGKIVTHMLDHYLEGAEDAGRLHQKARALLMNREYVEAEEAARRSLEARPGHVEARAALAEALIGQYRCQEAEAELKALLEERPDRADLWIALARAVTRSDKERAPEALAHVETAAALPSMTLFEYRAVAELIRRRAAPEAAERLARKAAELFPLHVEAYLLLIDVLIDQGRREEAIGVLRHAVELRRAPGAMRLQLANLLAENGETDAAMKVLRDLLAREPTHAAAAARLAGLEAGGERVPGGPAPAAEPKGLWAAFWSLAGGARSRKGVEGRA